MKRVTNSKDALKELKKGNDVWLDEREEKCLVTEAQEKCKCNLCKQQREFAELAIKMQMQWEIYKIFFDASKRKWKNKQKKKLKN
jgi:hypothetical protein